MSSRFAVLAPPAGRQAQGHFIVRTATAPRAPQVVIVSYLALNSRPIGRMCAVVIGSRREIEKALQPNKWYPDAAYRLRSTGHDGVGPVAFYI